jgi:hypothetical protein
MSRTPKTREKNDYDVGDSGDCPLLPRLNSIQKVVRGRLTEKYKDRIAYLFTPEGKNIQNPLSRNALAGK